MGSSAFFKNRTNIAVTKLLVSITIIFLFALWSCKNDKVKEQSIVQTLTDYYSSTNTFAKFEKAKKNKDSAYFAQNPDLKFAELVNTYFLNSKTITKDNLVSLDSLTQTSDFQNAHNLNKFYTYYYIAFGHALFFDTSSTLKNYSKAFNYIEGTPELYKFQHQKLDKLREYVSSFFLGNGENYFKYEKRELQRSLLVNDSNVIGLNTNNLAEWENEKGNYKKALEYLQLGLQYVDPKRYPNLFTDLKSHQNLAYIQLNRKSDYQKNEMEMQRAHDLNLISKREFQKFQAYTYYYLLNATKDYSLGKKANELLDNTPKICENRISLYLLYDVMAQCAKNEGNEQKEIEYLEAEYAYLMKCNERNIIYFDKGVDINKKLIDIYRQQVNPHKVLIWLERKDSLQKVEKENHHAYLEMIDFLEKRELQNINSDLSLQTFTIDSRNKLISSMSLLFIVLLLLLWYILKMYQRNQKNQSKIVQKAKLLDKKNIEIAKMNQEVKILAKDLEQSNESLKNFAKVAAHDIKSPISTIHQIINYLEVKYKDLFEREDYELFQQLNDTNFNLTNVINKFLHLSIQKESKKSPRLIDLNEILSSIKQSLYEELNCTHIKFVTSPNLPKINGDQRSVRKFLQYLIKSIINDSELTKKSTSIEIGCASKGNFEECIYIKISSALDWKHQNKMYKEKEITQENLRTLNNESWEKCQKLMPQHNGKIWVKKSRQDGITYFIYFPQIHKNKKINTE